MKNDSEPRLFIPFNVKVKNFTDLNDRKAIIIFIILSILLLFGINLLPRSQVPVPSTQYSVPAISVTTAQ